MTLKMMTNIAKTYMGLFSVLVPQHLGTQRIQCISGFCRVLRACPSQLLNMHRLLTICIPTLVKVVLHHRCHDVALSRSASLTHGSMRELVWGIDRGLQL